MILTILSISAASSVAPEGVLTSIILGTPVAARLTVVFLFGAILAAAANYCVDRFGWTPRYRSPWRRFPKDVDPTPRRNWADRIPIWGWLALSRFCLGNETSAKSLKTKRGTTAQNRRGAPIAPPFAAISGWESRCFWVRPFFVELIFAAFVAARFHYWLNDVATVAANLGANLCASDVGVERALLAWGFETLLFWIALCATLVDFDDYIIPDELVVPGAVVGLTATSIFPFLTAIPINWPLDASGAASTTSVFAFAERIAPSLLGGSDAGSVRAVVFGGLGAIWSFWCFALLDRRFYPRFGWRKAFAIFARRLRRAASTPILTVLWLVGLSGIGFVVYFAGDSTANVTNAEIFSAVDGLANALVGLFVGTILVWSVRLIGRSALGVEAMGFGDVVLTGALGAFVGWQGAVVVFFLAPFFGLVFGLSRKFVNNAPEIPYGPFLCLAALVYVVGRDRFYALLAPFFDDPLFVAGIGGVGFVLLAAMLFGLRILKSWARS